MRPNSDLLDLLLEVQSLDRIPRSGYLLSGISDPESVSEHTWQVAFVVWVLSDSIPEVDALRALEIGAQVILKATKVDGVYTDAPHPDKKAKRFESLDFGWINVY